MKKSLWLDVVLPLAVVLCGLLIGVQIAVTGCTEVVTRHRQEAVCAKSGGVPVRAYDGPVVVCIRKEAVK